MKKFITTIFAIALFLPVVAEAGISSANPNRPRNNFPEGGRRKKKCKSSGGVLGCRVPKPRKPKKCSLKRPCVPPKYYRPNPPKFIPMG